MFNAILTLLCLVGFLCSASCAIISLYKGWADVFWVYFIPAAICFHFLAKDLKGFFS